MKNIDKVNFEIEGICPLLMDQYNTEKTNPKTEDEYKREAEKKVYRDEKGNISIPSNALKACIRLASSELGKKMEGKKNRQMIRAGIFFTTEYLPIGKDKYDVMRMDIITRGMGDKVTRVPTYRPQFNKWKASGQINLIGVQPQFIKEAIEIAGLKYGLLGYRPEFGRFVLTRFSEVRK